MRQGVKLVFAGQFKRTNKTLDFDPYTEEQKKLVDESIHRLNRILKNYRKETLPLSKYEFYTGSSNTEAWHAKHNSSSFCFI